MGGTGGRRTVGAPAAAPDIIRYPVGPFKFSDPFRTEDRPPLLAQLTEAPAKLRAAVVGLNGAQLDTPYREGGWTLRQVVYHLADAQLNWYIRPKLAVTEDLPVTRTYAEQLWSELADARTGPIEPSLKIFEGVTGRWIIFLNSLKPSDWSRRFQNLDGARFASRMFYERWRGTPATTPRMSRKCASGWGGSAFRITRKDSVCALLRLRLVHPGYC